MITSDMYLLTIEMSAFGVHRNAGNCLATIIANLQHKRICDPRVVIPKEDFESLTNIRTIKTLIRHLIDLDKHGFVEMTNNKDHFIVNIMPFLTRLDELRAVHDERMKDVKHPFPDQYG